MNYVLRVLSLCLLLHSGMIWPMQQSNSTSNPVSEEIKVTISGVRDQLKNQNHIDAKRLVAQVNAEMSGNKSVRNENNSLSHHLNLLEKTMDTAERPSGSKKSEAEAQVAKRVANVVTIALTGGLEQERVKVMSQNTVLLGHPKVPIALYKSDLMRLPFMAIDVALAYKVFQIHKQQSVDYIHKTLTENIDQFITCFTELTDAQQELAKKNLSRQDRAQAQKKITELRQKLTTSLIYTQSKESKIQMMLPLALALVGHQASAYARNKFMKVNSILPESFNAYTKNNTGEYERFILDPMYYDNKQLNSKTLNKAFNNDDIPVVARSIGSLITRLFFFNKAPMSVTRALTFPISSPTINLAADHAPNMRALEKPVDALNRGLYKLIGLPDWFYTVSRSRITHMAIEAVVIWQALLFIDTLISGSWIKAALGADKDKLMTLLHTYKKAHSTLGTTKDKKRAESELKQFIAQRAVMPSWRKAGGELYRFMFMGRNKVNNTILSWSSLTIGSLVLWKSRGLIKAFWHAAKNNMISPEVSILVSLYALQIGFPFTIYAAKACGDIWSMGKKAISFVKRKINKSKNNNKPVLIGG